MERFACRLDGYLLNYLLYHQRNVLILSGSDLSSSIMTFTALLKQRKSPVSSWYALPASNKEPIHHVPDRPCPKKAANHASAERPFQSPDRLPSSLYLLACRLPA
jgi:hypothetical protein